MFFAQAGLKMRQATHFWFTLIGIIDYKLMIIGEYKWLPDRSILVVWQSTPTMRNM